MSVKFPSCVVTVIVADPAAFAVTRPVSDTLAYVSALDANVTALSAAVEGSTTASSWYVSPSAIAAR